MKKIKAQKDILYISISSFILVALWIGFSLYHSHVTSTIAPELKQQIEPIDPNFDTEVIQKLKNRRVIIPSYDLNTATSEASITPTPIILNTPIASGSATEQLPGNSLQILGQ